MTTWASDLTPAGLAVVASIGFEPVGQVLGVSVYQVGYSGAYCGSGFKPTSGTTGKRAGPLVKALHAARRNALARMTAEATALGADGVIGVDLSLREFPDAPQAVELRAIGTAVRARGRQHAPTPFLSDLSGQDFAALLRSGWVPTGIAMGLEVLVRHDDRTTVQQGGSFANTEVDGWTQLVETARHNARTALSQDVVRLGGEGVVVRDLTLKITQNACAGGAGGQRDHIAEALVLGTAIARFRRSHPSPATVPTLPILRLHERSYDRITPRPTEDA